MPQRLLPEGIYTPLPTFFLPGSEDLDLNALRQHVVFVAKAGTIPVLAGSAGEAPHLLAAERITLIKTARAALDDAGLREAVIVAGVGAPSTRETIQLACDAADAGADFAMVLPSGYYAGQLQAKNSQPLRQFFIDVAHASPLPVILYNFPGVSAGINLDSDLIVDVARACPNVVGVKLTCANVGKVTRITALLDDPAFKQAYPRISVTGGDSNEAAQQQPFQVIDGYIDILLPSMASGAAGAISGLPNVAPYLCMKLWTLASESRGRALAKDDTDYREAQRLQRLVALADGVAAKIGIAGLKMLVYRCRGYGGALPRRPLVPMEAAEGDAVMADEHIRRVMEEEAKLVGAAVLP
ncbi:hypothetical protein SCUCBS95973_005930 [Sporothrix curviconia]|uniref:Dihydrodipicolinate synthase n=1 Tax=Sporothrix curviconia TaxID=1260050 RepID=A0ABP0C0X1_9PEZI